MGIENWILYLLGVLITGGTGVWVYLKTTYWPHKMALEKLKLENELALQQKKEEAAEKQRQHEWEMAKREQDEKDRQREHERLLAVERAKSEAEEGGNLWKQVVEMQTTLMKRDEDKTEFIIGLATDRIDRSEERAREGAKEIAQANRDSAIAIAESYKAVAHQLVEMRTSLSVLVQDAVSREQERQALRKIPQALLDLLLQQAVYHDKQEVFRQEIQAFLEEARKNVRPSDGI